MDQFLGNRKKLRLFVKDSTISINGKTYRIFNINEYGVGFLIDSPDEIEIGAKIEPMILNGNIPVRVAGIARHVSQFHPPDQQLQFKSGWVCGTEFTTRLDLNGEALLKEYIAEILEPENEETEK